MHYFNVFVTFFLKYLLILYLVSRVTGAGEEEETGISSICGFTPQVATVAQTELICRKTQEILLRSPT